MDITNEEDNSSYFHNHGPDKLKFYDGGDMFTSDTRGYTPGFPRYIYTPGGGALRYFEIILDSEQTLRAYVDPSRQYAAEGLVWRDANTKQEIPKHRVLGYKEIDGY